MPSRRLAGEAAAIVAVATIASVAAFSATTPSRATLILLGGIVDAVWVTIGVMAIRERRLASTLMAVLGSVNSLILTWLLLDGPHWLTDVVGVTRVPTVALIGFSYWLGTQEYGKRDDWRL